MKVVDRYSPGGIYLGKALAFNLDQEVIDRFIERTTRALLFHERSVDYVKCEIEWRLSPNHPDLEKIPPEQRAFLLRPDVLKKIGDDIFSYAGYYEQGKASSLWLLNFYGGIEFMSIVREKQ